MGFLEWPLSWGFRPRLATGAPLALAGLDLGGRACAVSTLYYVPYASQLNRGCLMAKTRPLLDLSRKPDEITQLCRESDEPLFLEENGADDLVMMNLEAYQRLQARLELYRLLDEAEEDARQGDLGISVQTMRERLSL
jgi:hypothetical protein